MRDYSKLSDETLIAKCLEKDAQAWEALVRRYQRLIASVTFKFGLSKEDALDVFQLVYMALFKQLSSLKQQERLSSWLMTVTVRECWKLRKNQSMTDPLDEAEWEQIADGKGPTSPAGRETVRALERQHMVRHAIQLLPDDCQKLIEQLFYQEVPASYAEISHRLAIPTSSIGPTRGRCLAKLKKNLRKLGFI